MSKTKEQICIERGLLTYLGTLAPIFAEAMDEYAKQEAIGFLEWVNTHEKRYYFLYANEDDPNDANIIWRNREDKSEITSEQLYQLYLQSKQPK